ncbi:MAG TPA: YegS/Rv2252/BmrU family lipid kinase [Verrucomicrobiae bacterium]|nr:YegS/Rv2252/BmrU family lipid kinase [Verrucomicrobiae bacterium]
MKPRFVAIVNPAAGGGRGGRLAPAALERVRQAGVELEVARTARPGEAAEIAREAYRKGARNFLAVGGDGTAYEIVNGLFPEALAGGKPTLGFLPLGTGNSFLRDFSTRGVEHTIECLRQDKRRSCDVVRLSHAGGEVYFLNLVSFGFPADVGELANRKFKTLGELGYILGVFARLIHLRHAGFPHRLDGAANWERRPVLFLAFSNSKFTGGKMMIAPNANPCDGLIEYVRWSPIGRLRLIWTLPQLFTGAHIGHRLASRAGAKRVELALDGPVNVMVDGEILRLDVRSLEVLPGALDVLA